MPELRHILIVDDSETDRVTLRRHLSRDRTIPCDFIEVETVADAIKAIERERFDCVLLDFMLPDGTALDFIERARDGQRQLKIPIVIQTGTGSQADAVSLMKAGAHDYLVKKEIVGEALRLAVQNAIYRVETEQVIEAQQEELRRSLIEVKAARDAAESARQEAERANAAKDEFLAMLSHELRTPLTPVLSVVSAALSEAGLSRDLRETFALISRNVQVEARLIDDLLDLTRILKGKFHTSHEPVDLAACWQAARGLCGTLLEGRRIELQVQLPEPSILVSGDFARLQQMFWIMLKNAAEFTPEGGRIEVAFAISESGARVSIRDWGEGISAERLANIFEVFQRPGGSHRFGTLGIGLSIARAIAEAHGGRLIAESEGLGQGALFAVELPAERILAAAPGRNSTPPPASGRTVLVVDDHEDTRRVLARALRRRGCHVTVASSVATALEEFARQPADLLICDIGLPDGSGWDVIRKLRETSQAKAIAVTGYGMDSDIEKSKAAGFDTHVTKPIDFPELEHIIEGLFAADAAR